MTFSAFGRLLGTAAGLALLSGPAMAGPPPGFISGDILVSHHDDLATAGLGLAGLQSAAPAISSPPSAEELRRLAIYNNYRALIDSTTAGGFGTFYGPPDDPVPGVEYLAFARGEGSDQNVSLLVQIPDSFGETTPCLVTGPSSGSRGVYGAIGTAGEWAHNNNCAVAFTDKGTGTGAHNLSDDTVGLIDGTRADAGDAGKASTFTAKAKDGKLDAFIDETPDRWAFKHAHSRRNPEADWGRHVLASLDFALWAINDQTGGGYGWDDIVVIGSSVSNGGGATLRAAELRPGVFDGIVVSEPNVNPVYDPGFVIQQGAGAPLAEHSRTLYDYTTLLNVFQGCANVAPANATAPFNFTSPVLGANACTSLAEKGLVSGATTADQATDAQAIINAYGLVPEQNPVQPVQWLSNVPQAIAVTYANAYARTGVEQGLCGYGFAATGATFTPVALSLGAEEALFGTSNGIPPTGGVNLIAEGSVGGPILNLVAVSPSTGRADQYLDGALCLRDLETGEDGLAGKLAGGVGQILASGDLAGVPTIIVQGRADGILPVNHTGRAYYGLNQRVEGEASNLAYIEVLHAQHLDLLNGFPGFDTLYVPLHKYFTEGMDLMFAHLTGGGDLPASQVVRTVPRAPATPLANVNVPEIALVPAAGDAITFDGAVLHIPD